MIAAVLVASCSCAEADATRLTQDAATVDQAAVEARDRRTNLSVDDRLRDLLHQPAFAGHAHLLLPWDDRSDDEAMPLRQIGSLLPYHRHVEPCVVVDALNRMIDDVRRGQLVFHRFYTPAQRRADPTRENAGLFFSVESQSFEVVERPELAEHLKQSGSERRAVDATIRADGDQTQRVALLVLDDKNAPVPCGSAPLHAVATNKASTRLMGPPGRRERRL